MIVSPVHPSLSRARPPIWPVYVALFVAFWLVQLATVALVRAVAASRAGAHVERLAAEGLGFAYSAAGVMSAALVSASVFALVAVAGAWLTQRRLVAPLRLGRSTATRGGVVGALVGITGLSLATGAAAELLGLGRGGSMEQIALALSGLTPSRVPLALASIALLPGAAEEMFFRGLMQTGLAARWGRWPGIVLTAAAFGLMHLDPLQGSLAALAGLFLGWVSERFESIRPAMAAHAANNALFVALSSWSAAHEMSRAAEVVAMGAGTVALAGALAFLRSRHALRASRCAS